ncbi:MAG TPA: phosphate ABC transporter permease PstA [Candidatus Syntrophosphaera thermopropionivorans]|nr:phosphate ABC transporter permease PstA [Candidatus Syntrophosphaera thermopropionivorans]
MNLRKIKNDYWTGIVTLMLVITAGFLVLFIIRIVTMGASVLSWNFIIRPPYKAMTAGGIFPALVGTFLLTILSMIIALPIGIFAAIWLTHYGKPARLVNFLHIVINTMAGIPSIIFGLFGMAIFVNLMGFKVSLLSGSLTLAILALPVIINNTEQAIRSVPEDFSEASLALGATTRQTISRVVFPAALPNILTGAIISVGRVAGETAPIMFTAATFYSRRLPHSLQDEVMALPYHIYALMTEGTHPEAQVPIAYGTALVLLILVLLIDATAIIIRSYMRKKRQW